MKSRMYEGRYRILYERMQIVYAVWKCSSGRDAADRIWDRWHSWWLREVESARQSVNFSPNPYRE